MEFRVLRDGEYKVVHSDYATDKELEHVFYKSSKASLIRTILILNKQMNELATELKNKE